VRRLSVSKYVSYGYVDLDVEPLSITSGVVWTALNIDYPGHSFSHLGVFRGMAYCFSLKAR
jgi:glycosylphosphatidylinositol transamidase